MIKWNKLVPVHTELLSVTHEISNMFNLDNGTEITSKQILVMIKKRKQEKKDKDVKEREEVIRKVLID